MTSPEPLSADGAALLEEGRPVEAVEVLRQAVAAGEPSAPALLLRAYFDSGSWRAVVDWLGPLVEDGDVRWAGQLGVALAALGDAGNAEAALRLAVENGELAAANDLAILLRDERRLPEAVQVLLRATEAGDLQAPANLVELLLEDGDVPAAADVAQRYRDESRPDTLVALADVCVAQRRDEDAESLYRRAGQLGALRAHTAYGTFLLEVRGDPEGPSASSWRRAGTRSRGGRTPSAGSCSTTGAGTRRGRCYRSRSTAGTRPRPTRWPSWTGWTRMMSCNGWGIAAGAPC